MTVPFALLEIAVDGSEINFTFTTDRSKFFYNSQDYFGSEPIVRLRTPRVLDGQWQEPAYKEYGPFLTGTAPCTATVTKYEADQYSVQVTYHLEVGDPSHLAGPRYFIGQKELPSEVLGLFKPGEVTLREVYSPHLYEPLTQIIIHQPDHPVQRYLASNAHLVYGGRRYAHGLIPRFHPLDKLQLTYQPMAAPSLPGPVLVVETLGRSAQGEIGLEFGLEMTEPSALGQGFAIGFDTEQSEVKFFKLDDKILTKEELQRATVDLEADYQFLDEFFGKKAVERFGLPIYADGIRVYARKGD